VTVVPQGTRAMAMLWGEFALMALLLAVVWLSGKV
jgi:hypothetical protein